MKITTPSLSELIMRRRATTTGWLLLLLASLVAMGCSVVKGGPPPIRYFLIDALPGEQVRSSEAALALDIRDLSIPQYLDRFHLVQRIGGGELYVSEGQQWGESLKKNLMRVLVSNLGQRLATDDIGTPLVPSISVPDIRLVLDIGKFEHGVDGKIQLQARWQLSRGRGNREVVTEQAQLVSEATLEPDDYNGSVQAMSVVFATLSDRIAASIAATQADSKQGDGR